MPVISSNSRYDSYMETVRETQNNLYIPMNIVKIKGYNTTLLCDTSTSSFLSPSQILKCLTFEIISSFLGDE